MKGFFSIESPLFRFFDIMANIFLLSVMWIICSIPIVTIGASTTAVFYVTLRMVHNEESYVVKNFMAGFKRNFKQATQMWLGFLLIGGILAGNYYAYYYGMKDILPMWVKPLLIIVTVIYIAVAMYAFPLLARYENTTKQILKNAVLLMLKYLFRTILMLVVAAVLIAIAAWNRYTIIFGIILGPGLLIYVISTFMIRIFEILERDYMKTPEEEGDEGGITQE